MVYKGRLLAAVLMFFLVGFTVSSCFAADLKFGVMNVQQIIIGCDAGKTAKARFDKKMKELQTTFKAEEESLKALQAEIKKKSSAWSEEKKAQKAREFQKSGRELQAKTEDARFEMKRLQDKELEPILKALEQVVNKFGKDNGYTAIMDTKSGVVYFNESIEISDTLVKKLNKAMTAK